MDNIVIDVDSFPPAYDSGFSVTNPKHPRHKHYLKLVDEAKKMMNSKSLLEGELSMAIIHYIFQGERRIDSVNTIGAMTNTLQGVVYKDDNQITEIHYRRIDSTYDRYIVQLKR